MNFWTFLDRNIVPIIFFVLLPAMFFGGIFGSSIVKAFREPPKCEESK